MKKIEWKQILYIFEDDFIDPDIDLQILENKEEIREIRIIYQSCQEKQLRVSKSHW
jgi:hypothetical protein